MVAWAPIIAAAGAIGGSVLNNLSTNKQIDKANQRIDKAIEDITWNPNDYFTNYQYYNDPLEYTTYLQDSNAYDSINVDPSVLYAQNKALDDLINLSESKGLNAIDQQALNEIIDSENRNLQGQNEAILQNAMERGVYGSGLELAQRLQAAQSSANRMNNQDMDVMAQAQQRALEALSNYGNLASNMRGQDYNEQAQRAAAANAINQFNVNQMTNANVGNVDNRNKINTSNTDIYNRQQDSNVQAQRDNLGNLKDVAALKTEQYAGNKADARANQQSNNQLIGTVATSLGSAFDSSDKKKENQ